MRRTRVGGKIRDIPHMVRDFVGIVRGTNYFHFPDLVGRYFVDDSSYYVDFRPKVAWTGVCREEVPVLHVPSLGRDVFFPGMIVQYGLGSLDLHLETGDAADLHRVRSVAAWLLGHCENGGWYDNLFRELNLDPRVEFYSNNSAMTQGQVISFLVRAVRHDLLGSREREVVDLVHRLYHNLALPLAKGGGSLYRHGRVYLCECCRTDDYVVLNGWIYAFLGLYDYCNWSEDHDAERYLMASLDTLEDEVAHFIVPADDWSYYDNKGRLSSPTYHVTHMSQTDVLFRLTGRQAFRDAHDRLTQGYTVRNRVKYTSRKIVEKLRDTHRYSTSSSSHAPRRTPGRAPQPKP